MSSRVGVPLLVSQQFSLKKGKPRSGLTGWEGGKFSVKLKSSGPEPLLTCRSENRLPPGSEVRAGA